MVEPTATQGVGSGPQAFVGAAEVLHEVAGPVFRITINRPDKRNAIHGGVVEGIREGLRRAHAHPGVRVVVLTGAGERAFCAGGDLRPGQGFAFDFSRPRIDYAEMLREAQDATLPMIARINGACLAGGMGLAAMCDVAVAADHAVFGLPEVRIGLFPMQVLSLLQTLVPPRLVREWALTGESFTAQAAQAAGFVNHVVPACELDARVQWLVDRIADKSPTAIRRGKAAMRVMGAMSFDEAIAYTEAQIGLLTMTEDAREGLAAFNEKRSPRWTGR